MRARDQTSPAAREALATLCETYWRPVYEFIRHTGRSVDDARDLTQGFFARIIEKGDFGNARQELGHFRTFLLSAVGHFLANQSEHDAALKRGGGQVHRSLSAPPDEDAPTSAEPTSTDTPEAVYERQWALAALGAALTQLRSESAEAGRLRVFEVLSPFLTGDADRSLAEGAAALGIAENSARVTLHRLRQQYGKCLRDTLRATVGNPADVDAEVRYLANILGRRSESSLKQS